MIAILEYHSIIDHVCSQVLLRSDALLARLCLDRRLAEDTGALVPRLLAALEGKDDFKIPILGPHPQYP